MAEQEPHGAPLDERALAEALEARPATIQHEAHGKGLQFSLGHGDARLEVYPRARVTRLVAPALRARVELFDSTITQVSPGGVEFSTASPGQDASLTVVPGGGIVFTLVAGGERTRTVATEPDEPLPAPLPPTSAPVRAPETAQEARSDAADISVPPPAVRAPEPPHAAGEPASPPAAGEQTTGQHRATETEQEKISLTGRLGQDPSFRTTKAGSLVGRFPLAVHREDGHTIWHTVLAFGSRAQQLQRRVESGDLTKGREVDVVGYLHVNTRPGKDGTPRTVQEVYAVAVKKR